MQIAAVMMTLVVVCVWAVPRRDLRLVLMDEVELGVLVDGIKSLDSRQASDDEVAAWLKERTSTFGESGTALALARQLPTAEAYRLLHQTETWRAVTKRYQVATSLGLPGGVLATPNGRTYEVGQTINLAMAPEPPHAGQAGRGTVWRIVRIETGVGLGFAGRLIVEPTRRREDL